MRRTRRAALALLVAPTLAMSVLSCGVPTGDSTFDEIDGEVLGGLNDPTTTTTTTTTTVPEIPATGFATTTTAATTTEPSAPLATVAIYFISRGSLSPVTREVDPLYALNELVVLLEDGPPDDSVGQRLESFVEPGLIVGTPRTEGGVITVELDGVVFDSIVQQRQAIAQIVVTLLENTPAVGQVSFTIDGQIILIPADGGSREAASVDDFATLRGGPRSSAEPPVDEVPTAPVTTTATATATATTIVE